MKALRKFRQDCRGEMSYISTVIGVFVLLLFVVMVLNVFSILSVRQNMQEALNLTLEYLATEGSTEHADTYFADACQKAGVSADDVSFTLNGTVYLNEADLVEAHPADCIQLGDPICMQMTCRLAFLGGSVLFPDMQLQVQGSSLSEVFFK